MAKKKNREDLAREWLKKHAVDGYVPWHGAGVTYYELPVYQIVQIANYIIKQTKNDKN